METEPPTIETRVPASAYEDFDEPLQAAAAAIAEERGLAPCDVRARYSDRRDVIILTHPECRCECGLETGDWCSWSGPLAETVLLDYVPRYLRATARAAGTTRGCTSRHRVHRECAERLRLALFGWVRIVEDEEK